MLTRTRTRIRIRIAMRMRTRIRTRTRKDVNIVDSICCTMYTVRRVTINILQEVWFVYSGGSIVMSGWNRVLASMEKGCIRARRKVPILEVIDRRKSLLP